MAILKQGEKGIPVVKICREQGISSALYYRWRSKYKSLEAYLINRPKELEHENVQFKKIYTEERLKAEIAQEALAKKW